MEKKREKRDREETLEKVFFPISFFTIHLIKAENTSQGQAILERDQEGGGMEPGHGALPKYKRPTLSTAPECNPMLTDSTDAAALLHLLYKQPFVLTAGVAHSSHCGHTGRALVFIELL